MHGESDVDPSVTTNRRELRKNLAVAETIMSEALKYRNGRNRWRVTLLFLSLAVATGGLVLNVAYCPITMSLDKIIAARGSIIVTCVSVFWALIRMYVLEKNVCEKAEEDYNKRCEDWMKLDSAYRTFNAPKFRREIVNTMNKKKPQAKQQTQSAYEIG